VFPEADVPVVQLSIDETRESAFHYELGRRLRGLRDDGVLIIGSGNVVHNLRAYVWGTGPVRPFGWAERFDRRIRELVDQRDDQALVNYEALGSDARLAVPTPEHYLPLLYVLGASHEDDVSTFPVEGMDGGSISMLSIQFG